MTTPTTEFPRRKRLWARVKVVLSDWRYPAALAAAMLTASVLIAQVLQATSQREVLDSLAARAEAAECTDLREAEFERLLVALVAVDRSDPTAIAAVIQDLQDLTAEEVVQECYEDLPGRG